MASNPVVKHRTRAAARQNGRCHYCSCPMWDATKEPVESFALRHGISRRLARLLQLTAEHLRARQDGGKDRVGNIVAACRVCNLRRHQGTRQPPEPDAYAALIQRRVAAGRWHYPPLHRLIAAP